MFSTWFLPPSRGHCQGRGGTAYRGCPPDGTCQCRATARCRGPAPRHCAATHPHGTVALHAALRLGRDAVPRRRGAAPRRSRKRRYAVGTAAGAVPRTAGARLTVHVSAVPRCGAAAQHRSTAPLHGPTAPRHCIAARRDGTAALRCRATAPRRGTAT
jgi:hypothetical protein